MINHGIVTSALFLCVGMIYERTHTREIKDYGGVFKVAPVYATFLALFCLAAAGFPGLNSFVGEFLIVGSAFETQAVARGHGDLGRCAWDHLPGLALLPCGHG